jgi:hypothetical protein
VAAWFWQTYAWSAGVWAPGNHIEQYQNGVALAGATLDLDRALTADYGQWMIGDDMSWDEPLAGTADYPNRTAREWAKDVFDATHGRVQRVETDLIELKTRLAELMARPPVQSAPVDSVALAAAFTTVMTPALEAMEARLLTKLRDAVADLGEGGAAQVRADR